MAVKHIKPAGGPARWGSPLPSLAITVAAATRARGMGDRVLWTAHTCHCPESSQQVWGPWWRGRRGSDSASWDGSGGGRKEGWRETGESGWGGALCGIPLTGNVNTAQPAPAAWPISILGYPRLYAPPQKISRKRGSPGRGTCLGSKRRCCPPSPRRWLSLLWFEQDRRLPRFWHPGGEEFKERSHL